MGRRALRSRRPGRYVLQVRPRRPSPDPRLRWLYAVLAINWCALALLSAPALFPGLNAGLALSWTIAILAGAIILTFGVTLI